MRILGISGSLRRGSYNTKLLRAAGELLLGEVDFEPWNGLKAVPPFDEDDEVNAPAGVAELRDAIAGADAILFATPEYNGSVPGVLKNAIDWASRPPNQPFNEKPVAIMGASGGPVGTTRMQYDLRKILAGLNAVLLARPEVFIGQAGTKIDEAGNLTDETTKDFIRKQLEALAAWTNRLRSTAPKPA